MKKSIKNLNAKTIKNTNTLKGGDGVTRLVRTQESRGKQREIF